MMRRYESRDEFLTHLPQHLRDQAVRADDYSAELLQKVADRSNGELFLAASTLEQQRRSVGWVLSKFSTDPMYPCDHLAAAPINIGFMAPGLSGASVLCPACVLALLGTKPYIEYKASKNCDVCGEVVEVFHSDGVRTSFQVSDVAVMSIMISFEACESCHAEFMETHNV